MTNDRISSKDTSSQIADEAAKAGDTIKKESAQLAEEAKATTQKHAEQQFEKGQNAVASQVDTLSSAVDRAASELKEEDHPLGHYTREIADSMSGLSEKISNSSIDELAHDTRKLARENPGLFMLGGIAIGIAASRFFKASAERDSQDYPGNNPDRHNLHASGDTRRTGVEPSSAYAGGMNRHSPAMQTRRSEAVHIDADASTVNPDISPVATATPKSSRANPPVAPTEKTTSAKSVEESEGA